MGMFDYLIIDSQKLPLSSSETELLKNKIFQTKDLENCLLPYEINFQLFNIRQNNQYRLCGESFQTH
jgi:hypothetical protein